MTSTVVSITGISRDSASGTSYLFTNPGAGLMTVTMDQASAGQVDVTSTGTPVYSARTSGLHSLVNDFGLFTPAAKGFLFKSNGFQIFSLSPNSDKPLLTFGSGTDAQVWREASGKIKTNALVEIVPPAATGAITGLYSSMTTPGLSDATAGHFTVGQPYGAGNWSYGVKAFAPFTHYAPGLEVNDHRWLGLWGKGGAFLEDGSLGLTQSVIWPVFDDYQYDLNDNPVTKQYYNFHPQILSYNGVDGATVFSTGHGFLFDAYDMGTGADFGTTDAAINGKMGKFHFTTRTTATGGVEKGLITLSFENGQPGIYIGDYTAGATPDLSVLPDVRLFRESANVLATDDLFKAYQLQTTAATGTAPLVVASTTVVSNLNADLLDGKHESALFTLAENETVSGRPAFNGGTTGSTAPFTVDSTYKVTNLNADLLDGLDSTAFMAAGDLSAYFKLDEDETVTGRPAFAGAISSATPPFTVTGTYAAVKVPNLHADLLDTYSAGNASGNIPVSNGTVNTNLNADLLDGLDSADYWQKTETITADTIANPATISGADLTPAKLTLNSATTSMAVGPSVIQLFSYGQGTGATDGFRISGPFADYLGAGQSPKIWNYEAEDILIGSNNLLALTIGDDVVKIGGGAAGVDYQLVFDGESSDGTITYDEDNASFRFDQDIYLPTISGGNDQVLLTLQNRDNTLNTAASIAFVTYAGETVTGKITGKRVGSGIYGLSFSTFGYTDTVMLREGKMGIGDTTPDYTLDVAGTVGVDSYVDIAPIAAPAAPASGVRLYVDSTSGDLMAKNSAGTAVIVADF